MLFNKEEYYRTIETLENMLLIKIAAIIIIFIIASVFINDIIIKTEILKVTLIAALLGIIISIPVYIKENIRIEEMKMKLDIYEKIMKS